MAGEADIVSKYNMSELTNVNNNKQKGYDNNYNTYKSKFLNSVFTGAYNGRTEP